MMDITGCISMQLHLHTQREREREKDNEFSYSIEQTTHAQLYTIESRHQYHHNKLCLQSISLHYTIRTTGIDHTVVISLTITTLVAAVSTKD